MAQLIQVSEGTSPKIVDELVKKGYVREERKGRNRGMVKTRERVISLTRYDTETHAGDPTLPQKVWQKNRRNKN